MRFIAQVAKVSQSTVSRVLSDSPSTIARDYRKPVVLSGFEPLDIIQSVYMVAKQLEDDRREVENQYARVVRPEGNLKALEAMGRTMELRPFFEWRGLGFINHSALKLRPEYAEWDAEKRFQLPGIRVADPKACQCGEVLKGVIKPWECKVFGTACTPETPIGTCMVSSEGACAAYFNYGRFSLAAQRSRLPVINLAQAAWVASKEA
jgi:hydrogenase expression/formation protein HypD